MGLLRLGDKGAAQLVPGSLVPRSPSLLDDQCKATLLREARARVTGGCWGLSPGGPGHLAGPLLSSQLRPCPAHSPQEGTGWGGRRTALVLSQGNFEESRKHGSQQNEHTPKIVLSPSIKEGARKSVMLVQMASEALEFI